MRRRKFIATGSVTVPTEPPALNPPVNSVLPLITGTITQGQTLSVSNGTWSNSPLSYSRQWKRNGVAISGATGSTYLLVLADVGATITCTVIATNADGSDSAVAAGVGPIAATGTLAAPVLGYPTTANPPSIAITIPEDWQSGNVLKLAYSSAEAMSSPTVLTHTLTDSDTPGSTIHIVIPTLGGVTYFQAYGNDGADSANRSNIVKWGDTTAPTITSASTFNQTELLPLAVALTANETVTWAITGGADQTQFDISGSALQWHANGTQDYNSPADSDGNNTYAVQVSATDLGGNVSAQTVTVTVTAADKTPDAYSFTPVIPATPSTQYTSNTVTISGLTPGISVPVTLTGSGTYSKNGGAFTSAAGTAQNGDTFALRTTSGPGATDVVNLSLSIGLGSGSWVVSNTTNTAALTTTNGASKNSLVTVSGSPALNGVTDASTGAPMMVRANQSATGKKQFEVTLTHVPATNQSIFISIDDGTTVLGPSSSIVPGKANNLGITFEIGTWGYQMDKNSATQQSGATTVALNDVLTCEFDTGAGTVSFYKNGTQIGTTITGLGTITTTAWACIGSSANEVDFTANFGQSAFTHTLNSGYSSYGS